MNCLIDYILLDGTTSTVVPNSGLYVNRELTFPIKQVSSAITTDQSDLDTIWTEVQTKAIRKFVIRLKLGMQELFADCTVVTDDWICLNKAVLAMPLLYFLGSELMIELRHTNRINRYTTIDRDRAMEMKDEFDREFQVQLKAALQIINNDVKQEVGEIFTYIEALP